jgi:translation initiation factor 5
MFDFKNERFIVNGSHDASKLQLLLDGFIKRFVLCPECSNPETQLVSYSHLCTSYTEGYGTSS